MDWGRFFFNSSWGFGLEAGDWRTSGFCRILIGRGVGASGDEARPGSVFFFCPGVAGYWSLSIVISLMRESMARDLLCSTAFRRVSSKLTFSERPVRMGCSP